MLHCTVKMHCNKSAKTSRKCLAKVHSINQHIYVHTYAHKHFISRIHMSFRKIPKPPKTVQPSNAMQCWGGKLTICWECTVSHTQSCVSASERAAHNTHTCIIVHAQHKHAHFIHTRTHLDGCLEGRGYCSNSDSRALIHWVLYSCTLAEREIFYPQKLQARKSKPVKLRAPMDARVHICILV